MRWKIDPRVAWQTVAGEAVVVDLSAGRTLGLNETGTFVWSRVERTDDEEIAREMASAFRVETDRALSDVRDFLRGMEARKLVSPSP